MCLIWVNNLSLFAGSIVAGIIKPFYTKVDYSRQLKQPSETTARFSGSTLMEQNLNVYSGITGDGSFSVYKPAS
eukprot:COSAG01_NODE_73454_length_244_cov_14093.910345_1_plen_73_part_10